MARHFYLTDKFLGKEAQSLRTVFTERFADPRSTRGDRFVWDYWNVPGQYTLVRTPAQDFFPEELYQEFLFRLLSWGQQNLGCRGISPPWLSFYVDGCEQALHADVPHGPWAFVYSLTPWSTRKFSGGETLLAKPELLRYWNSFKPREYHEENDFFAKIPARFDRLLVFDPRLPHGVQTVKGTHDPREARLVIHGWFTPPHPFVEGALSPKAAAAVIANWEKELRHEAVRLQCRGSLSLRLRIGRDGRVQKLAILADSLVTPLAGAAAVRRWTDQKLEQLASLSFPKTKAASDLTLPLYLS